MTHSNVNRLTHLRAARRRVPMMLICRGLLAVPILLNTPGYSHSATISYYETEQLFFSGAYEQCQAVAREQVDRGVWNELWPELLIRCQLTLGQYEDARASYEQGLKRFGNRLAYRLLGRHVYRCANESALADQQLAIIFDQVRARPWRYNSMRDRVNLGRYFVIQGDDGRQILELLYDRVRNQHKNYPDVYLATAELALEKHDYSLAQEQLEIACQLQPSNPEPFYLLARALRESDGAAAATALKQSLQLNPRHVPSMLLQVDQLIDGEHYQQAEQLLTKVLEINLRHPIAWAYHTVLAHLDGQYDAERKLHAAALSVWSDNYEVDHLIGHKLSQKYRFRESVAYQRRALAKRPNFVSAKFQLAHDLLRLGDDDEGWQLATAVHDEDNYHVVAFNLVALRDELEKFRTLTSEHFVVRMDRRESTIYGDQVLALLEQAHDTLCPKYDVVLDRPVEVEIFPRQQDFAIRTFGLPGGAGYLGVCFGHLITANSPASQGSSPTNWQSVLWHEFCHVVTLQKTNNRMPRWLSEGISVYEERQRDPGWGQSMSPAYRQMILSDELTPVSQLSGAFLRPKSAIHVQFAYFESSLVVQYLIDEFGLDVLNRILRDLGMGMPIHETLGRHIGRADVIDREFSAYVRRLATEFGDQFDWTSDLVDADASWDERRRTQLEHPQNYWLTMGAAQHYVNAGDWQAVIPLLERMCDTHRDASTKAAAILLAQAYQETNQHHAEIELRRRIVRLDKNSLESLRRLVELGRQSNDWSQVYEAAQQVLAINPLLEFGQRALVEAATQLGLPADIVAGQRALLEMKPADPAAAHYQLAAALESLGQKTAAKRHVLKALEAAPRYRDAHRLLIKIVDGNSPPPAQPSATPPDERPAPATLDPEPDPKVLR